MDYLGIDRSNERMRPCSFFFFRASEIYNPIGPLKYLWDLEEVAEERQRERRVEKYVDR